MSDFTTGDGAVLLDEPAEQPVDRRRWPSRCAVRQSAVLGPADPPQIAEVLSSPALEMLRQRLRRVGLEIQPAPVLWKHLPGPALRVIFPTNADVIEEGTVVSVVVLHDLAAGRTLYAHPMHAGPGVNPLLKHLDGPMAAPKAQPGADGDRATRRIMEHKRALWQRFLEERDTLGREAASRRWRGDYYWALRRLYFCARCSECTWGHPHFDEHSRGSATDEPVAVAPRFGAALSAEDADVVARILAGPTWQVEAAYAARGGFTVGRTPRLMCEMSDGHVQVVFPTDVSNLQGGSLVALAILYHRPIGETVYGHCLSFGPEAETAFLRGDTALGLPAPQPGEAGCAARERYAEWRRSAWRRFWLDELEMGPAEAGRRWLKSFWMELGRLFGGKGRQPDVELPPAGPGEESR
ncbi:MAG: hypothetical protein ACE5E1_04380 [Phycisphaerae bacterium]